MKYLKLLQEKDFNSIYNLKMFYPGILYLPTEEETYIVYNNLPKNVFFILFNITESGKTIEAAINGETKQFQKTQTTDGEWIYYVKLPAQGNNKISLRSFNEINSDGSKTPLYAGFEEVYSDGSSTSALSSPLESSLDEKLFNDTNYTTALIGEILKTGSSDSRYNEVTALLEEKHIKTYNKYSYFDWFIGGDTPIDFTNAVFDIYKMFAPSFINTIVNSYSIIGCTKYDMIAGVLIKK